MRILTPLFAGLAILLLFGFLGCRRKSGSAVAPLDSSAAQGPALSTPEQTGPSPEQPSADPTPPPELPPAEPTARPTAPPGPVDFGPIEPERWKIIEGGDGDTFALTKRSTKPVEIIDTIVQASTRTALICFEHKGPFRGFTIRNSILRVEPGTLPLDRSYWAFRGYDMIDTLISHTEITGFGVVTPRHDEGHAIYLNLAGSFTVEDSHLHHNGGQAVQLVNRPAESVLPPGPAQGEIRIENTRISENGFNPDRGGFQVSIFGTGQSIVLRDVAIIAGQDDTEYPGDKTGGGLVIEAEDAGGNRPVWWKPAKRESDWTIPFTQGPTLLERVSIIHRRPNKPLAQIKGCEELIVQDCWFEGGTVMLDHPAKPGRNSGRIIWRGNGGDAELFVRGRRVGLVSQDFEFE